MKCTIVVGGQLGSEGKGKVVAFEAARSKAPYVVRCGGPNSGHSITHRGEEIVLRQIPCGVANESSTLVVAAGCVVDVKLICREADSLNLPRQRIVVDPSAVLLLDDDRLAEETRVREVGSTGSGTGEALIRRMSRSADVRLAGDSPELVARARVEPVAPLLHTQLSHGGTVIVEGTQGFGLSLLHGGPYPFATSRDTTAAAFAMEAGLSPLAVTRVVLVLRTFPIRVGGNSGPLHSEITWEDVRREANAPELEEEMTSVTGRLRRVGRFNLSDVQRACDYNRPTELAVMGLDRLDHANRGIRRASDITPRAREFIRNLEAATGTPVTLVGTGFGSDDLICLKGGGKWTKAPLSSSDAFVTGQKHSAVT